jgi:diguanylate cyclase (GGDEF)-like protein
MPVRRGLPSPRISTKLYGIVALFLGLIIVLAATAIEFAGGTVSAVGNFQREALGNVTSSSRLQVLLEQHRRMVVTAPFSSPEAGTQDEPLYRDLTAAIAGMIDHIAPERAEKLSQRFALLASQGGAVFTFVRDKQTNLAAAAAARYASAADGLMLEVFTESRRHVAAAEQSLERLAGHAGRLTAWTSAAAALAILVVPLCLLLLHRMLGRMRGIGSALIRLARNDTSVEIPGISDQDEFGELARSVAVFKAKSIELLNKKADFERLNVQLDAAINNMPLGLSMFDAQERLIMCNRRYTDMYDVPSELARPGTANCALWQHRTRKGARHSEERYPDVSGAPHSRSMLVEFGSGRVIEVSRQPIKGGGWVALHEDITERRRQEERITHMARHDGLTGLANRMLFRERLEESLQRLVRGQGFAVLCLDLDRFKAVNDTLGHPVGDQLLKQVAKRLLSCVRHGDVVARLGGDEFAIVQASARDPKQTEALAARIVETVSAPYDIDGNRIHIGTSIGITLAPRDGSDADGLMKNADLALYRTKTAGRRGYSFFEPRMDEEMQARRKLEVDLRRALTEDALDLVYHPIVCLESDQAVAFEALLRWQHAERGLISTDEFLALAEDIGLVAEIGGWTLRQACAQAARWPAALRVAVNVTSRQFLRRDFTQSVLEALAESGLSPQRLDLEIAESILHEDGGGLATLLQLRQLGVSITLAGFGSGRGSLASLRTFPFDEVKIGRELVADIGRSKEACAIVEAMIALGTSLGMATVAEGIEDFEQLAKVRSWGCTAGQGFLLGPPIPAGTIATFLGSRASSAQGAARRLTSSPPPVNRESGESDEPPESSQAA